MRALVGPQPRRARRWRSRSRDRRAARGRAGRAGRARTAPGLRSSGAALRGRARAPGGGRARRGSRAGGAARRAHRPRPAARPAPAGARSTSLTLTTSTAWCAVIARPASVMTCGWRQAVLRARLGQRLHDRRGVLLEAVVDRVVAARARALVVDAEAAADVDVADVDAGAAQLDEVARRLAHTAGDVAHVRDLRAHVEVQQLELLRAGPPRSSSASRSSSWRGLSPNLALSPPVFCHLPAPIVARRTRTPSSGSTLELARLLDHAAQLGRLLDHDEDRQAELAADQREPDVLAVLVAVADHDAARAAPARAPPSARACCPPRGRTLPRRARRARRRRRAAG